MTADQDTAEPHPAIRQWAEQLQELADKTGMSLRQLAEHVPWSHSTLARYLNGERVVDDAWELVPILVELAKDRGTGSSVDLDEIYFVYAQARRAYQEQRRAQRDIQSQAPTASPGTDPRQPDEKHTNKRTGRRRPNTGILLGTVGLIGLIGVLVVLFSGWGQSAQQPTDTRMWRVNIVGTWSAKYQQYLGVFRYRSPDLSGDTDKSTYHEGTTVSIVCQERQRRLVHDPTTGRTSTIWDRLDDGYWIPDLYTDLPKVSGRTPPLGIPTCD